MAGSLGCNATGTLQYARTVRLFGFACILGPGVPDELVQVLLRNLHFLGSVFVISQAPQ